MPAWYLKEVRGRGICGGGVDFFIRVRELDIIITFQGGKQRAARQRSATEPAKLLRW